MSFVSLCTTPIDKKRSVWPDVSPGGADSDRMAMLSLRNKRHPLPIILRADCSDLWLFRRSAPVSSMPPTARRPGEGSLARFVGCFRPSRTSSDDTEYVRTVTYPFTRSCPVREFRRREPSTSAAIPTLCGLSTRSLRRRYRVLAPASVINEAIIATNVRYHRISRATALAAVRVLRSIPRSRGAMR